MQLQSALRSYSLNHEHQELVTLVQPLKENGGNDLYTSLIIMKMMENRCPELQSELGDCYYQGVGVRENKTRALDIFKAAASRGSLRAHYDLGWYYYDTNEYMWAIEYFNYCISHRNEFADEYLVAQSYACLGDSYLKLSDPKTSLAIDNLSIAAEKYKHGFACRRLGTLYSEVESHYFDPAKCVHYYELGASYGNSVAAHNLAINYIFGDKDLNIPKNGKKAEQILLPFADTDDSSILRDLGLLYQRGDADNGVKVDYEKARMYYERSWSLRQTTRLAADLGYVYFYLNDYENAERFLALADKEGCCDFSDFLGRIYKDGLVGAPNIGKAVDCYERAFSGGGLNNLFTCCEYAELLEQIGSGRRAYVVAEHGEKEYNDICFVFIKANLVLKGKVRDRISKERAVELMEICTRYNAHKKDAYMMLGEYYLQAKEYRKAEINYQEAFKAGVADAAVYLGRLYENGGGSIYASAERAYAWFVKGAEAGSSIAQAEADCFKKSLFNGYKRVRSI